MTFIDHMLHDQRDANVRLDSTARDDAALYQVADDLLLAMSVDFGTPISSDPETWGRISALNALSDIYAMGATPLFALSIVGWPAAIAQDVMTGLMRGAVQTLAAEATRLLGGHTISSAVPLFGLSVTGRAHPDTVMLIRNAQPHQFIVITKPLGTGIITAAQKSSVASVAAIRESEGVMLSSNRTAAKLAVLVGIRAATDVTGYGLVGHLHGMLKASGCAAEIAYDAVPVIAGARQALTVDGIVPNSAERNYMALERQVDWTDTPLDMRFVLSDPQTSGGLLLCGDETQVTAFLTSCAEVGQFAAIVGMTGDGQTGTIRVMRRSNMSSQWR